MVASRKLRVFLCHASQDKPIVREIYQRLRAEDWINPWLDEEKLLPGQDWDMEIEKAVEAADVVLVFLSSTSVSKEGYIQRELRFALDIALEKPDGTIFMVPLRLDDCELPRRLRAWQFLDYFPADRRDWAYQRLLKSLKLRGDQTKTRTPTQEMPTPPMPKPDAGKYKATSPLNQPANATTFPRRYPGSANRLDLAGTLSLLAFFLFVSFVLFDDSSDLAKVLAALSGLAAGYFLWSRRNMPRGILFKITTLLFFGIYDLKLMNDLTGWEISGLEIIASVAAVILAVAIIASMQVPKTNALYATMFLGVFIVLISAHLGLNAFGVYPAWPHIPTIVVSVITGVLIWIEM